MNHGDTRSFRPLDVTFVLPSLEVGGAERVVVNLANGLQRLGHRPRIVLTGRTGLLAAQLNANVPVIELGHDRVRAALPLLLLELRRQKPAVVVTTHTHVNLALCAARRALPRRTRLVLREPTHTPDTFDGRSTLWRRRAQRILYPRADRVIVTSRTMERDLASLTRARVVLLANPIDVRQVRTRANEGLARGGDEQGTPGRTFITVGRLSTQKALPDLITAFGTARGPEDRLVLVGEGPEREPLEQQLEELDLATNVRLCGALPNPWLEVARADRFVLASRNEGMPNAVLEALSLGIPVLATEDLDVLKDLRDISPPGAVVLVAREQLAAELARSSRLPTGQGYELPRQSLLPAIYDMNEVVSQFVALIATPSGELDASDGTSP